MNALYCGAEDGADREHAHARKPFFVRNLQCVGDDHFVDRRADQILYRIARKHAVRCGGGANHRFGLDDAILIMGVARGLALIESIPDAGAIIVDAQNKVHISSRLRALVHIVHPPSDGL